MLVAKETQHIDAEKANLSKKFDLADLGEVNYLLGLNIERARTNRICFNKGLGPPWQRTIDNWIRAQHFCYDKHCR